MSNPTPDKEISYTITKHEVVFTAPTLPAALRRAADWIENSIPLDALARFSPVIEMIEIEPTIDPDNNTQFVFDVVVCLRDEFS